MTKKRIYALTSLYALLMLLILIGTVTYLLLSLQHAKKQAAPSAPIGSDLSDGSNDSENSNDAKDSLDSDEPDDSASTEDPDPPSEERWIVKEYMGQIGIFRADGTLEQLIDTYVKTLPKADRDLLGEGFEVQSKDALYSVIEDYSN